MLPTAPAIEAVRVVFEAIERGDWETVARRSAPETTEQFRRRSLAHVLAWAEYVAHYTERRGKGYGSREEIQPEVLERYGNVRLEWISGAPTIAELVAAAPDDFLARWLRFTHSSPNRSRRIVGAVSEGERQVHVVYRGIGWIPVEQVQVMSVVPTAGNWLLLLNHDVLRFAHLPTPDEQARDHT